MIWDNMKLPDDPEFVAEMKAIAKIANIPFKFVLASNFMYELLKNSMIADASTKKTSFS